MLLALTMTGICLGTFANGRARQTRAVVAIEALGGSVQYDCDFPADDETVAGTCTTARRWLAVFLGTKLTRVVVAADLTEAPCTDADMEHVAKLPNLYLLNIDSPEITDAGVRRLLQLKRLRILHLAWTSIGDEGVRSLCSLRKLKVLSIGNSPWQEDTITNAALGRISELESLEVLCVHGHGITDNAIPTLEKLRQLQGLYLLSTSITNAGVARLRSSLPRCDVSHGEE